MWVYEYIIRHSERPDERRTWWKQAEEVAHQWTREGLLNVRIFLKHEDGREQDLHWVPENQSPPQ